MEKRVISRETYEKIKQDIPNAVIQMLPEEPEKLLSYARRVKEVQFSKGISEELKQKMREHLLSDEEYLKTFYEVMAISFYHKKAVENPQMHMVVAQTGSGKSNLTAKILREEENCVFIDSDKYKHFRYDAQEIAKNDPVLYPFLTGPDAYDHADNVYQYALEHRYQIIKETAPSASKGLLGEEMEEIKKNGYQIDVHILAVGKLNSALSVHERYELQIIHGLRTAKLTGMKRHDESYEALEANVKEIEKEFEIHVYMRGTEENDFEPIKINQNQTSLSVIDEIREARKKDQEETKKELESRYQLIQKQMSSRNTPTEQIEQLNQIYEKGKKEIEE